MSAHLVCLQEKLKAWRSSSSQFLETDRELTSLNRGWRTPGLVERAESFISSKLGMMILGVLNVVMTLVLMILVLSSHPRMSMVFISILAGYNLVIEHPGLATRLIALICTTLQFRTQSLIDLIALICTALQFWTDSLIDLIALICTALLFWTDSLIDLIALILTSAVKFMKSFLSSPCPHLHVLIGVFLSQSLYADAKNPCASEAEIAGSRWFPRCPANSHACGHTLLTWIWKSCCCDEGSFPSGDTCQMCGTDEDPRAGPCEMIQRFSNFIFVPLVLHFAVTNIGLLVLGKSFEATIFKCNPVKEWLQGWNGRGTFDVPRLLEGAWAIETTKKNTYVIKQLTNQDVQDSQQTTLAEQPLLQGNPTPRTFILLRPNPDFMPYDQITLQMGLHPWHSHFYVFLIVVIFVALDLLEFLLLLCPEHNMSPLHFCCLGVLAFRGIIHMLHLLRALMSKPGILLFRPWRMYLDGGNVLDSFAFVMEQSCWLIKKLYISEKEKGCMYNLTLGLIALCNLSGPVGLGALIVEGPRSWQLVFVYVASLQSLVFFLSARFCTEFFTEVVPSSPNEWTMCRLCGINVKQMTFVQGFNESALEGYSDQEIRTALADRKCRGHLLEHTEIDEKVIDRYRPNPQIAIIERIEVTIRRERQRAHPWLKGNHQ